MDTPLVVNPTVARAAGRQPLSALSKWTVATLGTLIVMLIWLQVVVVRGFFPPLVLILGLPALVVAAPIVLTRWRWAPLLAVLYWILILIMNREQIPHDITHPEVFNPFAFTVMVLALAVVALVAGVGATVQSYRVGTAAGMAGDPLHLPRWFPGLLVSLAGICGGALLVGAIPQAEDTTGVSPEALAALPALGAGHFQYDQPELRVRAGQVIALRLENRDNVGHSFDIDEFNVHVPIGLDGPSLALFTPNKPGTYTYYCSLPSHRELGMVGTLIVEP